MDGPVEHDGGEPYDRGLEARVSRVEHDVSDIKVTLTDIKVMLARIEAAIPNLTTKADLASAIAKVDFSMAELRSEVRTRLDIMGARLDATLPHLATRADLAEKPSKAYMWGVMTALLAAYACGLAALAAFK